MRARALYSVLDSVLKSSGQKDIINISKSHINTLAFILLVLLLWCFSMLSIKSWWSVCVLCGNVQIIFIANISMTGHLQICVHWMPPTKIETSFREREKTKKTICCSFRKSFSSMMEMWMFMITLRKSIEYNINEVGSLEWTIHNWALVDRYKLGFYIPSIHK